jgi:hypothetical protein
VFLPDFETPSGGFDRIHTEVQSISELRDWLEHSSELDMRSQENAYDPEATGVLSGPKLDHLKTVAKSGQQEDASEPDQTMVSGTLGEFSLMDLLQLFAAGGRTGLLACTDGDNTARVFLETGNIMGATWNGDKKIDGLQSMKNAAAMEEGAFFFGPSNTEAPEPKSPMSMLQVALAVAPPPDAEFDSMETFPGFDFGDSSQLDKMAAAPFPGASETAPDDMLAEKFGERFAPVLPLQSALRELNPEELDVFQGVLNGQGVEAIVQETGLPEERCRRLLKSMTVRGYLNTQDAP